MEGSETLLLDRKAAAAMLGISLRGLDYLVERKELIARRIGKRVMIPRQSLLAFAKRDHPAPIVPQKHRHPRAQKGGAPQSAGGSGQS